MNINPYNTTDYEKFIPLAGQKNKPNSNPIKPNFKKAQMNVNLTLTKDYRKKDDFTVRINKPNSNPIFLRTKTNATLFAAKDYENETAFRPQKNKPNSNPMSKQLVAAGPRSPESAKMAQKIDIRNLVSTRSEARKVTYKKPNFLLENRLNSLSQTGPLTGTSFAYLEYMR